MSILEKAKTLSKLSLFTRKAIAAIKKIPRGKVSTYGMISAMAGNPRAARQVVWILNSYSEWNNLPWHRIVNRNGRISLAKGRGYELQKALLQKEGMRFSKNDIIDFDKYLWKLK
jgi:methylated-DNA-protein-cysteine methyltransferase-like protein